VAYETSGLVVVLGLRADGFVGHVADAAFDAVVNAVVAGRAESFVVIGRYAKRRAQLFVEASQIAELPHAHGKFVAVVSQQKFLVARVPQMRELALHHDRGNDGHLVVVALGFPAKLGAAIVLLDPDDAARAADGETLRPKRFDLSLREGLVDVPHGHSGYGFGGASVKAKNEARVGLSAFGDRTKFQRILTARAASSAMIVSEISDWSIVPSLAHRESTAVSVGENAVLVLKAR